MHLCTLLASLALAGVGPAVVTGIVLDERGRPAADVTIELRLHAPPDEGAWTESHEMRSGRDGRFVFRARPSGETRRRISLVEIRAVGDRGRNSDPVHVAVFPSDITLRLRPGARLVARIDAAGGELSPELAVRIAPERRSRLFPSPYADIDFLDVVAPVDRGRIVLEGLAPGLVRVAIHDRNWIWSGVVRARLEPGKTTETDVVLGRPGGARIEFVGAEGFWFPAARCILEPGEPSWAFDANGPGRTDLGCWELLGRYLHRLDLVPGEQQLTVVLKNGRLYRRRIVVRPGLLCEYRGIELAWRDQGLRDGARPERLEPAQRVAVAATPLPEAPRMEPRSCGDPIREPEPQPVSDPVTPHVNPFDLLRWLVPPVLALVAAARAARRPALASAAPLRRDALAAAALAATGTAAIPFLPRDPKLVVLILGTACGGVAVVLAHAARASARRAAWTLAVLGLVVLVGLGLGPLLFWLVPALVRIGLRSLSWWEACVVAAFAVPVPLGAMMLARGVRRVRALRSASDDLSPD